METFDAFVLNRSSRLLQMAYMLTHDRGRAEDLVQTALMRAWPRWSRIDGDPEPYVRRVMLNTYLSWWRRRWITETPTADLPEPGGVDHHRSVDERDEMLRALQTLPRQQRAVLVLRYYDDLSERQIADALDISPGAVKAHASRGLATLRENQELLVGVKHKIVQRRRNRIAVIGSALAVLLVLIIVYAVSPGRHRSVPQPAVTPGSGVYVDGTRIVATGEAGLDAATVTWPAQQQPVRAFLRCHEQGQGVRYALGDERLPDGSIACGQGDVLSVDVPDGVRRLTFAAHMSATASVDVRIGVEVGWDEYPLPAAPATLPPLNMDNGAQEVYPPEGAMSETRDVEVVGGKGIVIAVYLQGPAIVKVEIDGQSVGECKKWDYSEVQPCGVTGPDNLAEGTHNVTIRPEHAAAPWGFAIQKGGFSFGVGH